MHVQYTPISVSYNVNKPADVCIYLYFLFLFLIEFTSEVKQKKLTYRCFIRSGFMNKILKQNEQLEFTSNRRAKGRRVSLSVRFHLKFIFKVNGISILKE